MKQTKVSAALVAAIYELGYQAAENEQQLRDEIAYWRNLAEDKIMAEADAESQPDDDLMRLAIRAATMSNAPCTPAKQPNPILQAAWRKVSKLSNDEPEYKTVRANDWLKFVKEVNAELTNGVTIPYHNGIADISSIINMGAAEVKREMYDHAALPHIAKTCLWLQHQWRMRHDNGCVDLAQAVADHIENYTVPQYGDAPNDNVEKMDIARLLKPNRKISDPL